MLSSLVVLLFAQNPEAVLWSCEGQPPLPAGAPVEFEVGFAPNGQGQNLLEQAKLEGVAQFQRKLCPQSDECRRSLRSEISTGVSGRNAAGVCVIVFIESSRLTRWKAARAVTEFEEQLSPRVRTLLERAGHSAERPLAVRVGAIDDMPGAPVERSRWLKDQLEKALTNLGAQLAESGTRLDARLYGRSKEERLDLAIDLATSDGRFSESFSFSPLAAGADTPLLLSPAQAGVKGRVALMPLDLGGSNWTADQVNSFNLLIKQESGAQLNEIAYAVEPVTVSRPGRCDDRCASDAARAIGASHFITGSVTVDDGSSTVYLFLREVNSFAQKGELRLEGTRTSDLRRDFATKSTPFFGKMVADVRLASSLSPVRVVSVVSIATGAVALAVGAGLLALSQSTVAGNMRSVDALSGLVTNTITEQQARKALTLSLISTVLFVAGGTLVMGGGLGFFLGPTTNGAVVGVGGTL